MKVGEVKLIEQKEVDTFYLQVIKKIKKINKLTYSRSRNATLTKCSRLSRDHMEATQ